MPASRARLPVDADGERVGIDVGDARRWRAGLEAGLRAACGHRDTRVSGPESAWIPLQDTIVEPGEVAGRSRQVMRCRRWLRGGPIIDEPGEGHRHGMGHPHRHAHRLHADDVGGNGDARRAGCDRPRQGDRRNAHRGQISKLQHTFILVRQRMLFGQPQVARHPHVLCVDGIRLQMMIESAVQNVSGDIDSSGSRKPVYSQQHVAQADHAPTQHTDVHDHGDRAHATGVEEVVRRTATHIVEDDQRQHDICRGIRQPDKGLPPLDPSRALVR